MAIIRSIGPDGEEVLSNILDQYTGNYIQFKEVTNITDADVDGIIYIKQGPKYYGRSEFVEYGTVNVKWFGAKGDGITDDSAAFITASKYSNILIPDSTYVIGTNVTIYGNLFFTGNGNLKILTGVQLRLSSGTNVYADRYYLSDDSEPATIEGGTNFEGFINGITDVSGRIYMNGYPGNTVDKTSGSSYIFGGTNSYPHSLGAEAQLTVIGGGYDNHIHDLAIAGAILAGAHHNVRGSHGTIAGGAYQEVNGSYGFAGAGQYNKIHSSWGVVVGGQQNEVGDPLAADSLVTRSGFIGGGTQNINKSIRAAIVAGLQNEIDNISDQAFIGGGSNNKITNAPHASINGGLNGQVNAQFGTVMGGSNASVNGPYGTAGGTSSADGAFSMAFGDFNIAREARSLALGGRSDAYLMGMFAFANGNFSTRGDRQIATFTACRQTSASETVALGLYGGAQPIVLRDNVIVAYEGVVIARNENLSTENKGWKISGMIKRDAGVSTVALVGTPSVSEIAEDIDTDLWTVTIVADTVNGAMGINVTSGQVKNVRWLARVEFTELMF